MTGRAGETGAVPVGLLIDTNLLLLLVVGTIDPGYVRRHKRTQRFTTRDYDELVALADLFDVLVTTPMC